MQRLQGNVNINRAVYKKPNWNYLSTELRGLGTKLPSHFHLSSLFPVKEVLAKKKIMHRVYSQPSKLYLA